MQDTRLNSKDNFPVTIRNTVTPFVPVEKIISFDDETDKIMKINTEIAKLAQTGIRCLKAISDVHIKTPSGLSWFLRNWTNFQYSKDFIVNYAENYVVSNVTKDLYTGETIISRDDEDRYISLSLEGVHNVSNKDNYRWEISVNGLLLSEFDAPKVYETQFGAKLFLLKAEFPEGTRITVNRIMLFGIDASTSNALDTVIASNIKNNTFIVKTESFKTFFHHRYLKVYAGNKTTGCFEDVVMVPDHTNSEIAIRFKQATPGTIRVVNTVQYFRRLLSPPDNTILTKPISLIHNYYENGEVTPAGTTPLPISSVYDMDIYLNGSKLTIHKDYEINFCQNGGDASIKLKENDFVVSCIKPGLADTFYNKIDVIKRAPCVDDKDHLVVQQDIIGKKGLIFPRNTSVLPLSLPNGAHALNGKTLATSYARPIFGTGMFLDLPNNMFELGTYSNIIRVPMIWGLENLIDSIKGTSTNLETIRRITGNGGVESIMIANCSNANLYRPIAVPIKTLLTSNKVTPFLSFAPFVNFETNRDKAIQINGEISKFVNTLDTSLNVLKVLDIDSPDFLSNFLKDWNDFVYSKDLYAYHSAEPTLAQSVLASTGEQLFEETDLPLYFYRDLGVVKGFDGSPSDSKYVWEIFANGRLIQKEFEPEIYITTQGVRAFFKKDSFENGTLFTFNRIFKFGVDGSDTNLADVYTVPHTSIQNSRFTVKPSNFKNFFHERYLRVLSISGDKSEFVKARFILSDDRTSIKVVLALPSSGTTFVVNTMQYFRREIELGETIYNSNGIELNTIVDEVSKVPLASKYDLDVYFNGIRLAIDNDYDILEDAERYGDFKLILKRRSRLIDRYTNHQIDVEITPPEEPIPPIEEPLPEDVPPVTFALDPPVEGEPEITPPVGMTPLEPIATVRNVITLIKRGACVDEEDFVVVNQSVLGNSGLVFPRGTSTIPLSIGNGTHALGGLTLSNEYTTSIFGRGAVLNLPNNRFVQGNYYRVVRVPMVWGLPELMKRIKGLSTKHSHLRAITGDGGIASVMIYNNTNTNVYKEI